MKTIVNFPKITNNGVVQRSQTGSLVTLDLPELGFGGAPIGGLLKAVDDEAAIETVKTALKSGIRYFDTAPFYGFGLSEHRMGEVLRESKDIILSGKVGRV